MEKEKLIITLEVEDLPENAKLLDFQIIILKDGLLSRVFRNWKKVSYRKAVVTNMKIEKI